MKLNVNSAIKIPKIHIVYVWIMLFFAFSGFYYAKIPVLSPVYIVFIPTFLIILLFLVIKKCISLNISCLFGAAFVFYIFFSQFLVGGKIIAIFGSMVTVLYFILSTILLPLLTKPQIYKILNYFLCTNVLIYGFDTIYRLSLYHFNLNAMLTSFYLMKKQCLFYSDTNPLAINTTILTFFSFYLFDKNKELKYLIFMLIFVILTYLTLSRSGIIAIIASFVIYFLYRNVKTILKNKNSIKLTAVPLKLIFLCIFLVIISIIGFFLSNLIVNYLSADGSFSTKISLLKGLKNFFHNAPFSTILFGTGYNNGQIMIYTGLSYAHSYLATYVIETGLCGYLLMTSFLVSIVLHTPKTLFIFIPFIFLGISHISHAQLHVFYSVLALVAALESFVEINNKIDVNNIKEV